jgi:hypothetical protein
VTLRQRQPREEDPAYLAYVRTLPCMICQRPGPNDPAHLRTGARQYNKPPTGMGEKPSDCWTLPLCRTHHDDQHRNNELAWWARHGFHDPFAVAVTLYASRPVQTRPRRQSRVKSTKPRKAKSDRRPVPRRRKLAGNVEMQSRGFDKTRSRKFNGEVVSRSP